MLDLMRAVQAEAGSSVALRLTSNLNSDFKLESDWSLTQTHSSPFRVIKSQLEALTRPLSVSTEPVTVMQASLSVTSVPGLVALHHAMHFGGSSESDSDSSSSWSRSDLRPEGPEPPVARTKIEGFFCNRYLQFENIRAAVKANDINLIEIGYLRNPGRECRRSRSHQQRITRAGTILLRGQ